MTTSPASRVPAIAWSPPTPYTAASASAETRVSSVVKTAWRTEMSTPVARTRSARRANSADSAAGRPKSLMSVAPGAENRSVIWSPMAALCPARSRDRSASFEPTARAGTRNSGSITRDRTVTCQLVATMTPRVSATDTTFATTPERVREIADCAPITSLFRRETSAPVRVRWKNATGMRCTWSNTAVRRS